MNSVYFKLPRGKIWVYGGPYRNRPEDTFGVKMAAEIDLPCDVSVPTRDFSVPAVQDVTDGLIDTLKAMRQGRDVYVGCMGGIGRTGLFLAVLAKAMGIEDPVMYVRKLYYAHAVETQEQKDFVFEYRVPLRAKIEVLKLKAVSLFKSF